MEEAKQDTSLDSELDNTSRERKDFYDVKNMVKWIMVHFHENLRRTKLLLNRYISMHEEKDDERKIKPMFKELIYRTYYPIKYLWNLFIEQLIAIAEEHKASKTCKSLSQMPQAFVLIEEPIIEDKISKIDETLKFVYNLQKVYNSIFLTDPCEMTYKQLFDLFKIQLSGRRSSDYADRVEECNEIFAFECLCVQKLFIDTRLKVLQRHEENRKAYLELLPKGEIGRAHV